MYARKWSVRARRIRVVAVAICLVAVPLTLSSAPPQREYSRTTPDKLDELAANVLNVSPTMQGTLAVSDAKLMVPAGAVASALRIKITPLLPEEVARLDQGMNNVTRGSGGYRFTPDGMSFTAPVTLELPYDPTRIPGGQNPDDIQTFYYDVAAESWKAVPRVRVDKARKVVVSQTNHFTDFINATITVPDHPTPASLNPTSMKDIKVASPAAEINLIQPPQLNHQGTASLQYPIEIPPGRNRLQPDVAIAYNSGGGNGWVGLGWDLPMQAISIDTRWGVPRYDTGQIEAGVPKETETYTFHGDQLTPVAHRGILADRNPAGDKEFHTRVEGMFRKIIRHGNDPAQYWWEVIDKEGTKFFFGGDPNSNAPVAEATITDPTPGSAQNIFQWALREVRDANGNRITYSYERVDDPGVCGAVAGIQLYLQEIRYTGDASGDGPYSVRFVRDRDLAADPNLCPGFRRTDVMISGRAGFKLVTADLLKAIEVRLNSDLIRKYELEYEIGPFEKTLLSSITQTGPNGEFFHRHDFEYFDEVSTADPAMVRGFDDSGPACFDGAAHAACVGGAQTISGDGLLLTGVESTALDAEVATTTEVHGSAGVSFAGFSIGGSGGSASSDSVTHLTLIDVNGDSLLDQVYESGDAFFFRPNIGSPGSALDFGPAVALATMTKIAKEHSDTTTYGGSIGAFGATLSGQKAKTTTEGQVYLTDVNGDMLPDLVDKGTVYFNRLVSGVPTFGLDSPVPMTPGAPANTQGLVQDPDDDRAEIEQTFHLLDPIRRWVAPYSGTIGIAGQVRLLTVPPSDYLTADGVRASIQHNGTEIWSTAISDPNDQAAQDITGLGALAVAAGDRIYFRLQSNNDGAFDEVEFNPTITYAVADTSPVDENGMPVFVFNAAADYAYGGRRLLFQSPTTGSAVFAGVLSKSVVTTDDITIEVRQGDGLLSDADGGVLIHQQTILWNQFGAFPVNFVMNTVGGEALQVRIETGSRIDLSTISFFPTLEYTTVLGQPVLPLPNGDPTLVFDVPVTMHTYPRTATPTPYSPFVAPIDGTLNVHWDVGTTIFTGLYDADVTLAIKRPGQLLAKQLVQIRAGAVLGPDTLNTQFDVAAGDELYFTADTTAGESVFEFVFRVAISDPDLFYTAPLLLLGSQTFDLHLGIAEDEPFGGGFRYWSYGQYNGDIGRGEAGGLPSTCADGDDNDGDSLIDAADPECVPPIDENRLRLPILPDDPILKEFVQMAPFVEPEGEDHWRGQDPDAWIRAARVRATRFGALKFLAFPDGTAFGGDRGVVRYGGAKTTSGTLSLLDIASAGTASGTNWSDIDFLDFNGDRYPDVLGAGEVQLTLSNGALESERTAVGAFGRVRESESDSTSVSLGSAIPLAISDSRGKLEGSKTDKPAYSLSAGVGRTSGDFDGKWDLTDINGDGLPDYVRKTGGGLLVQLNLGLRFGDPESWGGSNTLRHEKTLLKGLNLGLGGTTSAGYGFGGGLSFTESTAASQQDLVDVNGDGLADIVIKIVDVGLTEISSSSVVLTVQFNTGNGFAPPQTFTGAMAVPMRSRVTVDRTLGANASVAIPAGPVMITLGGGASRSRSLGGSEVMLADLNGDSYTDHIYSDTDGNVAVNLNLHGRTNLLKAVRRPLGAVMHLDYDHNGNTTDLPEHRWVLARLEVFDGLAGDGVDTQLTTYIYEDGRYDRTEREFYGYGTVVEEVRDASQGEALYRTATRKFLNSHYYQKGLLQSEFAADHTGAKFTETVNMYRFFDMDTQSELVDLGSVTATAFPQLVRTDKNFYEGQALPGKTTFTTMAYDSFGNVTEFFDANDVGTDDDVLAQIGYFADPANHIVGIANSILVTSNGHELRRREAEIEAGTGDVRQIRQFLENGQVAVTDLEYFPSGNLRSVIGPSNVNGQRFRVDLQYDATTGTHVSSIVDSFGYQSITTYDLRFGGQDVTADINGHQTDYNYDVFGRVTSIIGPYETGTGNRTLQFEYHPDAPVPWAKTGHFDPFRNPADLIETAQFLDGLGRGVQTKKDGTVHMGVASAAADVMIVSGRVTFDFLGRVVQQFHPVVEPLGTPGAFRPSYDAVVPTESRFDVLDRVTRVTLPDGTFTTNAYGFGPDRAGVTQFETVLIDANGVQKRVYRDVGEQIVGIREFNEGGSQQIWTSYAYDALDQLSQAEDDHHNVVRFGYDNFGRLVSNENPDAGLIEHRYDLAGNMTAKITANLRANNQQIAYLYDFNLRTGIRYPNSPAIDVNYEYGPPGAPENRAGRISRIVSQAGTEEISYGKLGEITTEVKTIASFTPNPPRPEIYTTRYTYDSWGRLQQLVYPDNEVLTYSYDSGGQMRSANGVKGGFTVTYVRRMEYDKFEQRAFSELANNVRTSYTYRPDNRRLATMQTGKVGTAPFQNLVYQYDSVGNILQLDNNVPVPAASQFGGPVTQQFAYDDLYRLISADGVHNYAPNKSNVYSLSQSYDTIHNILTKEQTHDIIQPGGTPVPQRKTTYSMQYSYGSAKPHAPTHIGDRTYAYDANGNQFGWDHDQNGTRRTIAWDDENRIQTISDQGHTKYYKYDEAGERVIKRGPQGETAYVNGFFTVRNSTIATKHVFAGTLRIASKLSPNFTRPPNGSGQPEVNFLYFYHPDHLGSSSFISDTDGKLYEHIQYFPFGEPWVEQRSNTQRTPYGFTSKELDEETELTYHGARYYDSRTGVWQSPDPLLSVLEPPKESTFAPTALSAYTYVHHNPLLLRDPDGRDAEVTIEGSQITIKSKIFIGGRGASDRVARIIQADIRRHWDKRWSYYDPSTKKRYRVKFDVEVKYAPQVRRGGSTVRLRNVVYLKESDNYIEIAARRRDYPRGDPVRDEGRSYVTGGREGVWLKSDLYWTSAHEFSHLIGLNDRYTERRGRSIPNRGWRGNISAEVGGRVQQKNINAVISNVIGPYNRAQPEKYETTISQRTPSW